MSKPIDIPVVNAELLRRNTVFRILNEEQIARVVREMRVVRLRERDILFREGQAADRFFMLQSGLVKLYRLSMQGNEKVVKIVKPMDIFAIPMLFLEEKFYPVHAEAVVPSEVLEFPGSLFFALLAESQPLAFQVLKHFSKQLLDHILEIDGLCLQSAHCRMVQYLLDEVEGVEGRENQAVIHLDMPKHVVASRIAVKPETFSRILRTLARKGLITVHNREIVVHDLHALQEEATVCGRNP